ncbi:MAG: hypothetical protein ACKVPJ_13600 [Chitinophagales bacterium]
MKNKLGDMRNHLFAQLERLSDEELTKKPEMLDKELKRAQAIKDVAQVIVNSAKVEVDAMRFTGVKGTDFIPDEKQLKSGK